MEPLRILLLNSARRWIGEAAHTLALAREMEARGHAVWVGVRRGFALEERAAEAGLRILPLRMNSRFHPIRDLADARAIRRLTRAENIDLIHCNRGKDHWLAAAARWLMPGDAAPPIVRTRHVVTPARPHFFNRRLYSTATQGLFSVSRAAEQSLGALADRVDPAARRVILSAVDTDRFSPAHRDPAVRRRLFPDAAESDIFLGLVGRFQNIKGQRHFLKAAASLAAERPNVRVLLAGRASDKRLAAMRNFADSVGLGPDRAALHGMLDDLPQVLASLDIGVVASIGSEGSSRITLEYMASGLPVVATRVGGIPEMLRDGETGLLVEPRSPNEMAMSLGRLMDDPGMRRKMGEEGRRLCLAHFNMARWGDEIQDLYQNVVTPAHKKGPETPKSV